MDKKFRIVFQGQVRAGLNPDQVRQEAGLRLKASPAQVAQIFSGRLVTLKQGIDAEQALNYQRTLESLGMIVGVEELSPPATQAPPPAPVAPPLTQQQNPASLRKAGSFPEGWLHQSGFDRLEVAQQRLADAEALLQRSTVQAARQLRQTPDPASNSRQHARFVCSHCGTEHDVESELQLRISPRTGQRRAS